jgi:aminopeptidase YwaD
MTSRALLRVGFVAGASAAVGVVCAPAAASGASVELTNTYAEHVHVLASEYMQGRKPGTEGIERAARYITWHFENLGLEPAFPSEQTAADGTVVEMPRSSYRQAFPIGSVATLDSQEMSFSVAGAPKPLDAGDDFNALGYGVSGSVTDAPVVFVGYSIVAGDGDYTSYPDALDLTGKAAMVLRFEPMDEDGGSAWTDDGWTFAAGLTTKFRAAENRGASAILLVTPPNADDERAGRLDTLEDSNQGRPIGIPVIHITPEVADAMSRMGDPGGRSLGELIAAADAGAAISEFENVTVSFDAQITRTPTTTDNLGAILPGRGHLADQLVVVGAHYDHLGVSTYGSRFPGEMHLGADDNASGTSGMLTVAEALAAAWGETEGPARSVLFLAFSAEETGLNGSRHYVENPIAPLDRHYFMLNLDMIGSLGKHLEAGGVGSGDGMSDLLMPMFEESGITVKTDLSVGSGRSDHASFDRRQIPNLFFFTGVTDQYHTPDDTIDTLNIEGASHVAHLASEIVLAMATRPGELAYVNQEENDPRAGRQRMGGPGGVKVRVGIAPGDYSGAAGGIEVARVFEGTSADDAGIKAGDRIIEWNGEKVVTVQDWMPMLASHNPGDTIDVVIVRDGEEMTIPMTLKARQTTGG